MTFNEFVQGINPSPMAFNAYQGYWFLFGDLPDIPKGFKLYCSNNWINTDENVKEILNMLKKENKLIDKIQDGTEECERRCFFVQLQFSEIVDFWCGKHGIKKDNLYLIDCIGFDMWGYLRGELSFEKLKKNTIKTFKTYLKECA